MSPVAGLKDGPLDGGMRGGGMIARAGPIWISRTDSPLVALTFGVHFRLPGVREDRLDGKALYQHTPGEQKGHQLAPLGEPTHARSRLHRRERLPR